MKNHKDEISKLKDGDKYEYSDDDGYTGFEVRRVNNVLVLFSLSEGCDPSYANTYPIYKVDKLLNEINSWT